MIRRSRSAPNAVLLVIGILSAILLLPGSRSSVMAQEPPPPAGLFIYKRMPWHEADQAQIREVAAIREFGAVVYVTGFDGTERRYTRSKVFSVHKYLPLKTPKDPSDPLAPRIEEELKVLKKLKAEFPAAATYVDPRITHWEDRLRRLSAEDPPAPATTPEPQRSGGLRNTRLPAGGAFGSITLKNGGTMDVWITGVSDEYVKWDEPVKEGSGVYEERRISLDEVQTMTVHTAEDVARNQFQLLKAPEISLTPAAYQVLYQHFFRLLDKMQAQFGMDPRYPEWHAELVQIREDMEQAKTTHAVKFNGRWLPDTELGADRYEIGAKVIWASAIRMMALSKLDPALDHLRELQQQYGRSRIYVEKLPEIDDWLKQAAAVKMVTEDTGRTKKIESLQQAIRKFDREAAMTSLKLSGEADKALEQGDLAQAEELLRKSQQAWSKNMEIEKLRKKLEVLSEMQRKKEEEKKKNKSSTPQANGSTLAHPLGKRFRFA